MEELNVVGYVNAAVLAIRNAAFTQGSCVISKSGANFFLLFQCDSANTNCELHFRLWPVKAVRTYPVTDVQRPLWL